MRVCCALLLIATGCAASASFRSNAASPASGVYPVFDLRSLERSPFPSDRFTAADDEQNTARRVNLPIPENCTVEVSECEDVAILNQLDGFNLIPQDLFAVASAELPSNGGRDAGSMRSARGRVVKVGSWQAGAPEQIRRPRIGAKAV